MGYGLAAFRQHIESVEWCENGCAESKSIAATSMLKSKLMQWCVAQGRRTNFETVHPLFRALLEAMWETSPLSTVVNENLNK